MVSISDHRDADGLTDWDSYRAAQVNNGERCSRCGGDTGSVFGRGHPDLCSGCKAFESNALEVTHEKQVRCPYCKTSMNVYEEELDVFNEGETDVCCGHCGRDYTVETRVSYTFTSRPSED